MPRRNGIRLTKQEELQIIEKYQNQISINQIQKECSCGAGTIYSVLSRNNIPKRTKHAEYGKCKVRDYFHTIDTEAKAYFLGLLIADGSASGDTRITITLQKPDKDILETFAKELGMKKDEVKIQKARPPTGEQARLRFSSLTMREDLVKLGFVPKKTHKTYLPKIPSKFMSHLIRGIFDGDGHVSKYIVYISGTKRICSEIQAVLQDENIDTYLYRQKDTNVWYLKGQGKEGRTNMLKYLYQDSTIFLRRKKEIADLTHLNQAPLQCDKQRKLREFGENPEKDNPEPSLGRNSQEGVTTSENDPERIMNHHERGAAFRMPVIKSGYPNITHLFKESLFKDSKPHEFIYADDIV